MPQTLPSVISGTVFQDIYGTGVPAAGDPGLTPVFVILQGVGNSSYYSTTTDSNGNFSITVNQPGTYTMSIVDATGLGYSLVSEHVGTLGGTPSLSTEEIKNISILGGETGTQYDFGLNSTGGIGGEHPWSWGDKEQKDKETRSRKTRRQGDKEQNDSSIDFVILFFVSLSPCLLVFLLLVSLL